MLRRLLSLFLLMALAVATAFAHAILLKSSPAANATVSGSNVPITLTFSSRIDVGRSRFTLIAPDQAMKPIEITDKSASDHVTAALHNLKPGSYSIRWLVLAVDGHITRGEVPFRVQ